jgi:hypothetical protein
MTKKVSKIVKDIVKPEVAPKTTFGTDPNDPWSAKANINETNFLNAFLRRRGLNPKHVSMQQKVAHSKTGAFQRWVQQHMHGGKLPTFNDPMREQVGSTGDIHHVGSSVSSHVSSPTRIRQKQLKKSYNKHNIITPAHGGIHETTDKKDTVTFDIPLLIRMLELAREDIKSDADLHKVVEKLINIRKKGVLTMDDYEFVSKLKESLQLEDTYQDTSAPTQTVGMENSQEDGPNNPALNTKMKKKKVSETFRRIKEIYQNIRMSEDMYAWDAEDKDTKQPLGKKPKFIKPDDASHMGENKPKASAILTGGKTMTGQDRDDVEIDPSMRARPGQPQGNEPVPKTKKK